MLVSIMYVYESERKGREQEDGENKRERKSKRDVKYFSYWGPSQKKFESHCS